MLNNIYILNFDDSITKQKQLVSQYKTKIIDLKDLGPQARFWLDRTTGRRIKKHLEGTEKSSIIFLGSGDFHHLSHILIDRFAEPINVIIFDYHPDWDVLPPRLGCGSWVSETLKKKNILKLVLIGASSDDLSSFWVQTGNLASLRNNRVEIYPHTHPPSWVCLKKIPKNLSVKVEKKFILRKIYWNELRDKDLQGFFFSLIEHLATKDVYLSIDKDCLKKEYALTNWEEGKLSLRELLLLLKLIKENLNLVGVDIVGDYSSVLIKGRIKNILSNLDHPKENKVSQLPESFVRAINEETNLKILETLTK